MAVVVLFFAYGCTDTTTNEDGQIVLNSLRVEPRSITFVVGGSKALNVVSTPVVEGLIFTWSSTDSSVAPVHDAGVVKAISEGTAEIICSYNDQISARCSVKVIPKTDSGELPDKITLASLANPLSQSMIFSSRQLRYPGTLMQCFDLYDDS